MKVIIISEDGNINSNLQNILKNLTDVNLLQAIRPGIEASIAISQHKPDLIVMEPVVAEMLNFAYAKGVEMPRTHISASTHQGIQLVPVAAVHYFKADHKYVVAYHDEGELLIDDTLVSLEKEFKDRFVRIHRSMLVARDKIEALEKAESGGWYVVVQGIGNDGKMRFSVSRRQLPHVRKALLKEKT